MHYSFSTEDRWLLAVGGVVAIAVGAWVVATFGPIVLWPYMVAVSAIFGVAIAPIGFAYGRGGEAVVLVWFALFIGPFALLVMLVWLRDLPNRARSR